MSEQQVDEEITSSRGWHDNPIKTAKEDLFGRAAVAEQWAKLIAKNHSADHSIVYGLEGPWGCGKSSVIALLTEELRNPPHEWPIATFTPWATTGTDGLLSEFFAVIANAVPEAKNKKEFREKLIGYMEVTRPLLSRIPTLGGVVIGAFKKMESRLKKPWNQLFEELTAEIRKIEAPILVVVDDIDRLQTTELLDLLKVVRLLGRFPGVDFLLAYDEQTLSEILQGSGEARLSKPHARSFMEKIVQYKLSIPLLFPHQISELVECRLTELLERRNGTNPTESLFDDTLYKTMTSRLRTPRAIERFLTQVVEEFSLHAKGTIDDMDLVLVVFFRMQFPEVFSKLPDWKPKLTTPQGSLEKKLEGEEWNDLVHGLENLQDSQDALAILKALFPVIKGEQNPSSVESPHIANPNHFDRYLGRTTPCWDISSPQLKSMIKEAAGGNSSPLRNLLLESDDTRTNLVLTKIDGLYQNFDGSTYADVPSDLASNNLFAVCMELLGKKQYSGQHMKNWCIRILCSLTTKNTDTALYTELDKCALPNLRLLVISGAHQITKSSSETDNTFNIIRTNAIDRMVHELINHLRDRDNAPTKVRWYEALPNIWNSQSRNDLSKLVHEELNANHFTREDVAVRLVTPSLEHNLADSLDTAMFTGLTGTTAPPWPELQGGEKPVIGVEEWDDLNWSERRKIIKPFFEN